MGPLRRSPARQLARHRRVLLLPAVVLALVAAGCGNGSDDPLVSGDGVDVAADGSADGVDQGDQIIQETPAATGSTSTALALPQPGAAAGETADAAADPNAAAEAAPATQPAQAPNGSSGTTAPAAGATTAPTVPPSSAATATTQAPTTQATVAPVANRFPNVSVTDLASGQAANMSGLLGGGDRPVLLWFWSPF